MEENTAKRLDIIEPKDEIPSPSIKKPLAYEFEFLEVFAGAAKITKLMDSLGVKCGPPIELTLSPELDMKEVRLMEWISHPVFHRGLCGFHLLWSPRARPIPS